MLVGKVKLKFKIEVGIKRGVVIGTDVSYNQIPENLRLKVGDMVELRSGGVAVLRSKIVGLPVSMPFDTSSGIESEIMLRLSTDVREEDVPLGAEVWTIA